MKPNISIDPQSDLAIAEKILERIFINGRITRIEIKQILNMYPENSYKKQAINLEKGIPV